MDPACRCAFCLASSSGERGERCSRDSDGRDHTHRFKDDNDEGADLARSSGHTRWSVRSW